MPNSAPACTPPNHSTWSPLSTSHPNSRGDLVTFHPGGPVTGVPTAEVWQRTVAVIQAALAPADSRHIRRAIDLGPWPTWLPTTSDNLQRLFDDVGSTILGIKYDPSDLAVQGIDPRQMVRRFAPHIWDAHLGRTPGTHTSRITGDGIPGGSSSFRAGENLSLDRWSARWPGTTSRAHLRSSASPTGPSRRPAKWATTPSP
jgi:sugar phosphate isomerase/epimerase